MSMKTKGMVLGLIICLMFLPLTPAWGLLVTDSSSIPGPQLIVNFSQFTSNCSPPNPSVQVGDLVGKNITMEGSGYYGNISYSLGYTFWTPQNGYWRGPVYTTPGVYFTTTYDTFGVMIFRFKDGPVRAVGGFVNYDPHESPHPTITALDINDQPLESYDLASAALIYTPSAENQGGFRGIVRPQADIYGFSYGNGNLVLTDLTFTNSPSPNNGAQSALQLLLLME
jgi:hypothetical protein